MTMNAKDGLKVQSIGFYWILILEPARACIELRSVDS
jgi:hypothetical protein